MRCGGLLTDALTKMLTPGTSTRDIKVCAFKKKRLLLMDKDVVAEHRLYDASDTKQSRSADVGFRTLYPL
jgi:hypothetical protein